MKYLHYQVDAQQGDIVEVTIDRAANVQLLDEINYQNYEQGRGFRYFVGHATVSPVRLPVPQTGHWHVVIDLGGGAGHVRASVRVLAGAQV